MLAAHAEGISESHPGNAKLTWPLGRAGGARRHIPALIRLVGLVAVAIGVALAMAPRGSSAQSPSPTSVAAPVPTGLTPPQRLNDITIAYPEELLKQEHPPEGVVEVKFVVSVEGTPQEIEVARGVHPLIDAAVVDALPRLKFEPGRYGGLPVEVTQSLRVQVSPRRGADDIATAASSPERESPESDEWGDTTQASTAPDEKTGPIRVEGIVLEAGRRSPVVGATVTVISHARSAAPESQASSDEQPPEPATSVETDGEGRFVLRGLPDGRLTLVATADGFDRSRTHLVELKGDRLSEFKLYIPRAYILEFRTTVTRDASLMPSPIRHELRGEELEMVPISRGDPLRAIQNFPGMARTPFGVGHLLIRGSSPRDSAVFLAGHRLPRLYHFGGLSTVVNSEFIDKIELVPGNFDAQYGDAIGGVVSITPKTADPTPGVHGYVDIDFIDINGKTEVPVGKGSFSLAGRRSHLDGLVGLALRASKTGQSIPIPRYWDYQAAFDHPVGDGDLAVRVLGADDRFRFVPKRDNEIPFQNVGSFHRADLSYRVRRGPWSFVISPSYLRDLSRTGIPDDFSQTQIRDRFSVRSSMTRRMGSWSTLRFGTEFVAVRWQSKLNLEEEGCSDIDGASGGASDGPLANHDETGVLLSPALYTTWRFDADPVSLAPEVRYTQYASPISRGTVDPRLRTSWKMFEGTTLKGGVGVFSQAPPFSAVGRREQVDSSRRGRLRPERSLHTSLALSQQLPWELTVELAGYYKYMWDLVSIPTFLTFMPSVLSLLELPENDQEGRVYGLEVLVRKNLTKQLFGWAAYTLSRSDRRTEGTSNWELFDLDQTHLLTIVAGVKLKRRYRISARFRLTSGNPFTPCLGGVYDVESEQYMCVRGDTNSARAPTFHQLDLRFEKTWVRELATVSLYVDLINAYNRRNVEFQSYNADYTRLEPIRGLPFLPVIGVKTEY
ncbi:MAG: carboxypeptidase regulatory-like domain-containing protein [Nannocystaceae bacterium]